MTERDPFDAQLEGLFARLADRAPSSSEAPFLARPTAGRIEAGTIWSSHHGDHARLLRLLAIAALLAALLGIIALGAGRHRDPGDPFQLTGGLLEDRWAHSATRLLDGRVLIAGGIGAAHHPATLTSAELYDPATGRFTPTGAMRTARAWHASILLTDGRVLVAGGVGRLDVAPPEGNLASTEIYDPTSGSFVDGPDLSASRGPYLWAGADPIRPVGTRLVDGSVLVTGGDAVGRSIDTFDPAARTMRVGDLRLDPEPPAGVGFSAGCTRVRTATPVPGGRLFLVCVGGYYGGGPGGAVWFDPTTGLAESVRLPARQSHRSAALIDGQTILLAGGWDPSTPSAELYDIASDDYRSIGGSRTSGAVVVTLADGSVLSLGGLGIAGADLMPDAESAAAELYRDGRFVQLPDMSVARAGHTATALDDGRVLIVGGGVDPRAELFEAIAAP